MIVRVSQPEYASVLRVRNTRPRQNARSGFFAADSWHRAEYRPLSGRRRYLIPDDIAPLRLFADIGTTRRYERVETPTTKPALYRRVLAAAAADHNRSDAFIAEHSFQITLNYGWYSQRNHADGTSVVTYHHRHVNAESAGRHYRRLREAGVPMTVAGLRTIAMVHNKLMRAMRQFALEYPLQSSLIAVAAAAALLTCGALAITRRARRDYYRRLLRNSL